MANIFEACGSLQAYAQWRECLVPLQARSRGLRTLLSTSFWKTLDLRAIKVVSWRFKTGLVLLHPTSFGLSRYPHTYNDAAFAGSCRFLCRFADLPLSAWYYNSCLASGTQCSCVDSHRLKFVTIERPPTIYLCTLRVHASISVDVSTSMNAVLSATSSPGPAPNSFGSCLV